MEQTMPALKKDEREMVPTSVVARGCMDDAVTCRNRYVPQMVPDGDQERNNKVIPRSTRRSVNTI